MKQDALAVANLREELPHQQRHAGHVEETEHWVIRGPRQLISLGGPQPQRWMLPGVEDGRCPYGPAEAIEHLKIHRSVGVWRRIRGE